MLDIQVDQATLEDCNTIAEFNIQLAEGNRIQISGQGTGSDWCP